MFHVSLIITRFITINYTFRYIHAFYIPKKDGGFRFVMGGTPSHPFFAWISMK